MVDASDSKSDEVWLHEGSSPSFGTTLFIPLLMVKRGILLKIDFFIFNFKKLISNLCKEAN